MTKTKRYELWASESDGGYSFFESSNEQARRLLAKDAKLVWEVEARDWVEAQTLKHWHLGWEPYVPPSDAEELGLKNPEK